MFTVSVVIRKGILLKIALIVTVKVLETISLIDMQVIAVLVVAVEVLLIESGLLKVKADYMVEITVLNLC